MWREFDLFFTQIILSFGLHSVYEEHPGSVWNELKISIVALTE